MSPLTLMLRPRMRLNRASRFCIVCGPALTRSEFSCNSCRFFQLSRIESFHASSLASDVLCCAADRRCTRSLARGTISAVRRSARYGALASPPSDGGQVHRVSFACVSNRPHLAELRLEIWEVSGLVGSGER